MTKPKKFRVGQWVYCKPLKTCFRVVRWDSYWKHWMITQNPRGEVVNMFHVTESEIRPLTKRESAK